MKFMDYMKQGLVMNGFANMPYVNNEMAKTMIQIPREYEQNK
ncbi:hypothetical protein D2E25_1604 [Bifidobacterium goeldii]|uniref:Uncharacterized protein n=1 Tax=Bifidobacterium goeldii TaxID=2306975 RepID=A0A430FHC6_9BIFI|nr:hypothetical protein [Bifidobacterium goeldii]RSX52191.1 hypothetical protein D2E25_1604 [Bifidobacterium goeldii]